MTPGLGPVFAFEWLRTARNWRVYAFRILFGITLLAVLGLVAMANAENYPSGREPTIQQQAEEGRYFSMAIVITQIAMILMVAPAATAGTLCLDKQRGTLAHVMTTDLTSAEVVLGKLFARLLPVFGLVFASLGIMAICTMLGGVDPMGLIGTILVCLGCAMIAGTLAFFLSIWAGKTHEVIMASYLIVLIWVLYYPMSYMMAMAVGWTRLPTWNESINPFWLVAEWKPGQALILPHILFMAGCFGISVMMILVAIWRLRAVAIRQMNRPAGAKSRKTRKSRALGQPRVGPGPGTITRFVRRFSPSLDRNPVLWREWHRMRPSWWTRLIWYAYTGMAIAGTAISVFMLASSGSRNAEVPMVFGTGLLVSVGLLLMSVTAATALAEERVRGSLDVLLSTPLSTQTILRGKWWGVYRTVPVLAVLPAVLVASGVIFADPFRFGRGFPTITPPVTGLAALFWGDRWQAVPLMIGLTLAYGAAITSFGLAMATWISRLDRAVTATVSTYIFIAVAWLFLMMMITGEERTGAGLATASPFMGSAVVGLLAVERHPQQNLWWKSQLAWSSFWILANFSLAAIFFKATLMSFNRKLGRIPDEGIAPPVTPDLEAEQSRGLGWRIRSGANRPAVGAATTSPPLR